MHRIKNKKLLSILMAGIISYACLGIDSIYANEDTDNIEDNVITEDILDIEIKDVLINDINNIENVGVSIKTQGTITKIEDNKIYIKDESGEGIVYLENIVVDNLNVEDCISIIGIVNQVENENVITVNDVNNINLVIIEEVPTEEKNPTEEQNPIEENNNDTNNKPSKPSNQQSTSKPTSSVNTSKSNKEENIVVNSIKSKSKTVIETELTSTQWENVKLKLEEKAIKVKDLKNNKIRITQVNNECGDNIWIVNDPRMLDSEEEVTNTIGKDITDTLLYSEYDVTESKWNTIVEDVESGIAKIKYDSDKNIKVIYQKSNGKDSIITLNKIEIE